MQEISYSKGEWRVLDVIRTEIHANGRCVLSLAEVADLARVCRSTASLAIRKARGVDDLVVVHRQEEGLTNVITLPKNVVR